MVVLANILVSPPDLAFSDVDLMATKLYINGTYWIQE